MFLQSFSDLYCTSAKVILVCTTFACLLYCCNFASPIQNFHLIRVVHFLLRVQTDLSRRQHPPNKRCALNNECAADNLILRYNITVGVNMSRIVQSQYVSCEYPSHTCYWSLMVAFIIYCNSPHFCCIVQLLKNMHMPKYFNANIILQKLFCIGWLSATHNLSTPIAAAYVSLYVINKPSCFQKPSVHHVSSISSINAHHTRLVK